MHIANDTHYVQTNKPTPPALWLITLVVRQINWGLVWRQRIMMHTQ